MTKTFKHSVQEPGWPFDEFLGHTVVARVLGKYRVMRNTTLLATCVGCRHPLRFYGNGIVYSCLHCHTGIAVKGDISSLRRASKEDAVLASRLITVIAVLPQYKPPKWNHIFKPS